MISPVVSVLMTCYNRAEFLSSAIESVLAQSFRDFELIVSDDASTDGSADVARRWAALDSRIRVSVNPRNLGDYPNRNQAASLARGEYLKYLDSDDLMYPHCLAVMVTLMDKAPTAGIGISLPRRHTGGPAPMLLTPRMCYQREFLGQGLFSGGPGAAIIRRETFNRLGGFKNAGNASDDLFWLDACAKVNVLLLPADLTWYRMHSARASSAPAASEDYFVVPRAAWAALEAESCPLRDAEIKRAKNAVAARLMKRVVRDAWRWRFRRAVRRYRASGLSFREMMRHVRPLRLDPLAGTPLGPSGDYVIPSWLAPSPECRRESGDSPAGV